LSRRINQKIVPGGPMIAKRVLAYFSRIPIKTDTCHQQATSPHSQAKMRKKSQARPGRAMSEAFSARIIGAERGY
jgi:hypothetical protein